MRQLKRASDLTREHLKDPEYRKLYEEVAREEAQNIVIFDDVMKELIDYELAQSKPKAQLHAWDKKQMRNKPWR